MNAKRTQRSYDHRLLRLVRDTGDASIATRIGVPRSTAAGWLRRPLPAVTTTPRLDEPAADLPTRIAKLEARVARLAGALRVLLALLRIVSPDLARVRVAGMAGTALCAPLNAPAAFGAFLGSWPSSA